MRRTRNAKIVATLGPASSDPTIVRQLFMAGVDVFRLNFSHGEHADHQQRFETLRALEKETGRPIGILADLQGPKLRVGTFADGPIVLEPGLAFRLNLDLAPGDDRRATLPHPEVFAALVEGAELMLDDGKLRLTVERCGKDFAETRVVVGGKLSERKGVNVPGVLLSITTLTEKDHRDLEFALAHGADRIALSFVQRAEDVSEARALIGERASIVVKLEKAGLTFHGLRRSLSSLMEWLEVPAGAVAQIQGVKPSATAERHYTVRRLELLEMHHKRIEAWILEHAGIVFDAAVETGRLRAVAG